VLPERRTVFVIVSIVPALYFAASWAQSQDRSETGEQASRVHPKTPWGDPDIQGVWNTDNNSSVPLEGPPEVAGK